MSSRMASRTIAAVAGLGFQASREAIELSDPVSRCGVLGAFRTASSCFAFARPSAADDAPPKAGGRWELTMIGIFTEGERR